VGILVGITFASLLITQQMGIYNGLMTRTYGFLTDTGQPHIWVMDPSTRFADDIKPVQDMELFRVRGVPGVDWAVPLFKGQLRARLPDGNFQAATLVGLDDASLIGGPPNMIEGELDDLRQSDAVIVDLADARKKWVKTLPNGETRLLEVGDEIEINDNRAVIVGISDGSPTFATQPRIYTTYTRALRYAPAERKLLTYILVGADPGQDLQELTERIEEMTGLQALTHQQFKDVTYDYFFYNTGIPINFGTAVILGFIVGIAIAGQTFYNFTLDNLPHLAVLRAMGASRSLLSKMIIFQAFVVGSIGYGVGLGLTALFGYLVPFTELSFKLTFPLLLITGAAVFLICSLSALLSILKVLKMDPAMVFRE
jgi:putative ABC transport system permease protein